MGYAVQWARSLVFNINVYLSMFIMSLYFTPLAVMHRDWAFRGVRSYCRYVRWSARWMIGLETEVRGAVPEEEVLIASKHQSFLDIIMLVSVLPRPKFIMKSILRWAPILGWYGMRIGCVPVDRGKRGAAIEKMKADVASGLSLPGQLIIYPEGTRMAPGAPPRYKIGTAVLYDQLEQPCIPVATNVGLFWPRRGVYRKPGRAVMEFLPTMAPGLEQKAFMAELETVVEDASNRLMAEAGFEVAKMKPIETIEELLRVYDAEPAPMSLTKVVTQMTPAYRKWVAASKFCILSTVGPEGTDASPRGDDGPAVVELDPKTLAMPDWRGNNRLDSLRNIVRDHRVSLMFMVPGSNNVVRINGTAALTADEPLRQKFERKGKLPRTVIVVSISEMYFQCAKAIMRSRLWSGESTEVPSAGAFVKERDETFDAESYDAGYAEYAKPRMW